MPRRIYEDTSDSATTRLRFRMEEGFDEAIASPKALTSYVKKRVDREKIVQAMDEAFELIGGVPRLALWANENPGKFFTLWSRHAAKEQNHKHSGEIKFIKPAFGPSPLDGDVSEGEFIDHSDPSVQSAATLPALSSEE